MSLVVESPFASFEDLEREALACTKCPLATQGRSQVVFGDGDPAAELVFVGEPRDLKLESALQRLGALSYVNLSIVKKEIVDAEAAVGRDEWRSAAGDTWTRTRSFAPSHSASP